MVPVSDPTRGRDQSTGLAPEPFVVRARFEDRWVLGNQGATR